jgi:hypothetical protein
MDANARSDAEASVDKAFIAAPKAHAEISPVSCGNFVPITVVRRPDGRLRVRTGHRRTIGCPHAGVRVLGFIAGDEGDVPGTPMFRVCGSPPTSGASQGEGFTGLAVRRHVADAESRNPGRGDRRRLPFP